MLGVFVLSAVVTAAPTQMPVPTEAQTLVVYSGMAMNSPQARLAPLGPRDALPLWVRSLAAPLLASPVLPPPPPRIQSKTFRARPVVELASGGLCMGLEMANNRNRMRLELIASSRAAAFNFRF